MNKELPLYSEEAEKALLSEIILNPLYLTDIELSVDDFGGSREKIIFETIKSLDIKDINLVTLKEALEKNKKLKEIGGISYLIELTENINIGNISSYQSIIKDFSIKRKIKNILLTVNSKLDTLNYTDLLNLIYNELGEVEKHTNNTEELLFDLLADTLDYIELIKKSDLIGYSFGTNFKWLDKITGGFQRGKIYRIGGPSNVGKSWLLYNFLISLLIQTDKITFFSLENSKLDILKNFFGLKKGVNTLPEIIKREDYDFTTEALWFETKRNFNISREKNLDNILRIALKNKSEFIFIDYIQLLQYNGKAKSETGQWEEVAKKLQDIASKYNIGIIDLSQVSNSTKQGGVSGGGSDEFKGAGAFKDTIDVGLHIFSNTEQETAKYSAISNGEKDKAFCTYNKIKVTKNRLGPGVGGVKDYCLDFNLGGKYILEDL